MTTDNPATAEGMRLDKWLWAARFFKTRQLAIEAVAGGKVEVNGQRAKPGREIHVGTRLCIHKDSLIWDIRVEGLNLQRRPASEAAGLYSETEESIEARRLKLEQLRLEHQALGAPPPTRPTKRDRRLISRFTKTD